MSEQEKGLKNLWGKIILNTTPVTSSFQRKIVGTYYVANAAKLNATKDLDSVTLFKIFFFLTQDLFLTLALKNVYFNILIQVTQRKMASGLCRKKIIMHSFAVWLSRAFHSSTNI